MVSRAREGTEDGVAEADEHADETTSAARPGRRGSRPRTERLTKIRLVVKQSRANYPDELAVDRPRTREDCRGGERPCPYVSCKHHLYLNVNPDTGAIQIAFPDLEPWELAETCALDVAERGGITLEEVGSIMNLTRERIRQIEVRALSSMRERGTLGDRED